MGLVITGHRSSKSTFGANKRMFRPECLRSENYIYFKVTMEAQLGLIGGTMGLLTGFSILSGVEVIYFLFRFIFS